MIRKAKMFTASPMKIVILDVTISFLHIRTGEKLRGKDDAPQKNLY